jgi:uncharacterized membrane protein YdjX (TVP38/TMEM64 family)
MAVPESDQENTSSKSKIFFLFWLIITIIPIIGILIGIIFPDFFFGYQEEVRKWLSEWGKWGIILFILIQVVQVILTPISHYTTSVMGGFLYGPVWGGVFNWIGRIIGHLIAYWIAKTFARPFVERWVDKKTVAKFDYLVAGNEKNLWSRALILFSMIFLPFFPDDELSYLCGLAKFRFKYFLPITLLGHLGGSFALAYAGAGIDTKDPYFWILTTITFICFGLLLATLLRLRKKSNDVKETSKSSDV